MRKETDSNDSASRRTQTNKSRRNLLCKLGAAGIATAGVLPGGVAGIKRSENSEIKKVILRRNRGWKADVDQISDVDGVKVQRTSKKFIIVIDKSEIDFPSESEIAERQQQIDNQLVAVDEEIRQKLLNQTTNEVSTQVDQPVTLGTSKTLSDMTTGTKGSSGSGFVTVVSSGSTFDTTADRATAAILGTIGLGSATRYSTIGVPFAVSGSGSQAATIAGIGDYRAGLTTLGAGTANVNIKFQVLNRTTGTTFSSTILDGNGSLASFKEFINSFNRGLSVTLRGGDKYTAFIRVATSISVGSIGEACADAGPQDGDDYSPKQGSVLKDVKVTF